MTLVLVEPTGSKQPHKNLAACDTLSFLLGERMHQRAGQLMHSRLLLTTGSEVVDIGFVTAER